MNIFNRLFVPSLILCAGIGAAIGFGVGHGAMLLAGVLGVSIGDYSMLAAGLCGVIGVVLAARWWATESRA